MRYIFNGCVAAVMLIKRARLRPMLCDRPARGLEAWNNNLILILNSVLNINFFLQTSKANIKTKIKSIQIKVKNVRKG